jgi:hypothetical protein
MSHETETFWVTIAEKFFGLILIIIGALMLYYTTTSTNVLGMASLLFGLLSIVLLVIGIFLLLIRSEE